VTTHDVGRAEDFRKPEVPFQIHTIQIRDKFGTVSDETVTFMTQR